MANKKVSQLISKPSVLVTDLFPIADPSTGQLYKTTISDLGTAIGSGVSSVNGLVGAVVLDTDDIQELVSPTNKWFTDTRARAALSASSPLTYNSGTGAFGIQVATGSQNGYLSSTDWTTFNAKQAALSGTGFVKISGTTISYDNSTYLTTSAAASTYLALAGGTLTGALNGTSATFTGDLTLSGTNPRLYFTDTDNNPDYFISNTDGTFTIYDVTNSTARFTIGTTGNATFTNAITGGGSITGQSLYSNGIISAGTSLSVGTFVSAGGSLTGSALYVTGMTAGSGAIYHTGSRLTFANYNTSGTLHFEVNGGTGALTLNADTSATFTGQINSITGVFGTKGGGSYGVLISDNDQSNVRLKFTNTGSGGRSYSIVGGLPGANNSSFAIYDETAGSTRFNISDTGAATFSSTVATNGVVFPATQVASSDPNSLDDYEEGTWTIGIAFGGSSVGISYFLNGGTYTKIGNMVTVNGLVSLTSKGTSVGDATITGLPFASGSGFPKYSTPSLRMSTILGTGFFQGFLTGSSSVINLSSISDLGVTTALNNTNFANNSDILVSLTYFV